MVSTVVMFFGIISLLPIPDALGGRRVQSPGSAPFFIIFAPFSTSHEFSFNVSLLAFGLLFVVLIDGKGPLVVVVVRSCSGGLRPDAEGCVTPTAGGLQTTVDDDSPSRSIFSLDLLS